MAELLYSKFCKSLFCQLDCILDQTLCQVSSYDYMLSIVGESEGKSLHVFYTVCVPHLVRQEAVEGKTKFQ